MFWLLTGCLEIVHHQGIRRTNSEYTASLVKGHKKYICKRVYGTASIMRDINSEVELCISDCVKGLIIGHIHTSFTHFIDLIPDKECFVSPIPEYHILPDRSIFNNSYREFIINIPHRIHRKNHLKSLRVWHGDIHKRHPFKLIPEVISDSGERVGPRFSVTSENIIISTTGFSQFFCTSCEKTCDGQVKAMLYGSVTPDNSHMLVEMRFACWKLPVWHCRFQRGKQFK